MRNGNDEVEPEHYWKTVGSYPTYEEWKQDTTYTVGSAFMFLSYL